MPIPTNKIPDTDIDGIEIRSPNRPLPRSAKKAILKETEIKTELSPPKGYSRRMDGVIVADYPSESTMEKYELSVVCDPDIVYESDHGETINIYTDIDTVIMDGQENDRPIEEVIKMAEEADHITLKTGSPPMEA
jgi:hypothetical protein